MYNQYLEHQTPKNWWRIYVSTDQRWRCGLTCTWSWSSSSRPDRVPSIWTNRQTIPWTILSTDHPHVYSVCSRTDESTARFVGMRSMTEALVTPTSALDTTASGSAAITAFVVRGQGWPTQDAVLFAAAMPKALTQFDRISHQSKHFDQVFIYKKYIVCLRKQIQSTFL